MKNSLFLSLVLVLFISSCKKDKDEDSKAVVVIVYQTSNTDALAYESLLEASGRKVDVVEWTSASSYDFSAVKLVVIAGSPSFGFADTLHASAAKLRSLSKPFLYIGRMGGMLAFYNKKTANWQSSAVGPVEDVKAMNTGSTVFSTPNAITIPGSGNLTLTNPGVLGGYLVFYGPAPLPAGVVVYGQSTSDANYKQVTIENGNSGLFGWLGAINDLSATGKNLLVNLSFAVGGL